MAEDKGPGLSTEEQRAQSFAGNIPGAATYDALGNKTSLDTFKSQPVGWDSSTGQPLFHGVPGANTFGSDLQTFQSDFAKGQKGGGDVFERFLNGPGPVLAAMGGVGALGLGAALGGAPGGFDPGLWGSGPLTDAQLVNAVSPTMGSVGTSGLLGMTPGELGAISSAFPLTSGVAPAGAPFVEGFNMLDPSTFGGATGGAAGVGPVVEGFNILDPSTYGVGGGAANPMLGQLNIDGFAPPGGFTEPTIPPSGPGVSTPITPQITTTAGPTVSGTPIGGDPNLPVTAQGTPGVPSAPGTQAGTGSGIPTPPPGSGTVSKTILDRLGITKDGSLGPNAIPLAGLAAGAAMSGKNATGNKAVEKAAETQKAELTQLNAPTRAAADSLIQQGMSGTVPPNILSQFDQSMKDRIEQIKQRYASMGRDPNKDSAAAAEMARAKQDRDNQIANYSSQLLQQGLSAAGLAQGPGGQAAQAGVNAAIAGAHQDQQFSAAMADTLKQMAMLQALTASRTAP